MSFENLYPPPKKNLPTPLVTSWRLPRNKSAG